MKLEDAQVFAEKILGILQPFCERVAVAGSIRRGRPEVNDIDVVAIPKPVDMPGGLCGVAHYSESQVWKDLIPIALLKHDIVAEMRGQELLRFKFTKPELQVDLYRARPETWGVILLIRTGSKEHNVKLCSLARSKGLKLSACEGVVTQEGFGKIIGSKTEEEIFSALGLGFVEPKDREVRI